LTLEQAIQKLEFSIRLIDLFQRGAGHKFIDLLEEGTEDAKWYYYWQSNLWHNIARKEGLPGHHPPGTYTPRHYIWNIQRTSGIGYPANYLVSLSPLPIAGDSNGEAFEVNGTLGIPLLYNDLRAIDRIDLKLRSESGSNVEITLEDKDGRRVVFKIEQLPEEWTDITLPVYGMYYSGSEDSLSPEWLQDSTWARWLTLSHSEDVNETNGFFWRLNEDGLLELKERFSGGAKVYVSMDEHIDWSNVRRIIFETSGKIEVQGIYQLSEESIDFSDQNELSTFLATGGAIMFKTRPGATIEIPGTSNPGYSHTYRPGLKISTQSWDGLIIDMNGDEVSFIIPAIGPNIFRVSYSRFLNEIVSSSVGLKLQLSGPKYCRENR